MTERTHLHGSWTCSNTVDLRLYRRTIRSERLAVVYVFSQEHSQASERRKCHEPLASLTKLKFAILLVIAYECFNAPVILSIAVCKIQLSATPPNPRVLGYIRKIFAQMPEDMDAIEALRLTHPPGLYSRLPSMSLETKDTNESAAVVSVVDPAEICA